jgi:hypothetical protein
MITLVNALEKAINEQKDDNFGFDSRIEYQNKVLDMFEFVWGPFGRKMKEELISLGEQNSRTLKEITNQLLISQTFSSPANFTDRDNAEINIINQAIRFSYELIHYYHENETITDSDFTLKNEIIFSSMLDYIIQGCMRLEGMRQKLIHNPVEYFRKKEEVEIPVH